MITHLGGCLRKSIGSVFFKAALSGHRISGLRHTYKISSTCVNERVKVVVVMPPNLKPRS